MEKSQEEVLGKQFNVTLLSKLIFGVVLIFMSGLGFKTAELNHHSSRPCCSQEYWYAWWKWNWSFAYSLLLSKWKITEQALWQTQLLVYWIYHQQNQQTWDESNSVLWQKYLKRDLTLFERVSRVWFRWALREDGGKEQLFTTVWMKMGQEGVAKLVQKQSTMHCRTDFWTKLLWSLGNAQAMVEVGSQSHSSMNWRNSDDVWQTPPSSSLIVFYTMLILPYHMPLRKSTATEVSTIAIFCSCFTLFMILKRIMIALSLHTLQKLNKCMRMVWILMRLTCLPSIHQNTRSCPNWCMQGGVNLERHPK